jgi:hypothetical protein
MKAIPKSRILLSRRVVIISAVVIIAFSCSKTDNTVSSPNTGVKLCNTLSWSDLATQSGVFTGNATNGSYRLTDVQYSNSKTTSDYKLNYDSNGHLLNDQPGVTYTYTQNYLSQINVDLQNGNGNGNYNFDSLGHFTSGVINFTTGGYSGPVTATYTYDSNEDPVKISATGTINTQLGPINVDLEVTGDFLTDKTSLLPFIPVFTPATSDFSPYPYLSKHLLNKWVATYTVTGAGQSKTFNLNYQFTYTYDNLGNVATMVNSANPNDTYTFTYSGCN